MLVNQDLTDRRGGYDGMFGELNSACHFSSQATYSKVLQFNQAKVIF